MQIYLRACMLRKIFQAKLVFLWFLFKVELTNTLGDGCHFHINISIFSCMIYPIHLKGDAILVKLSKTNLIGKAIDLLSIKKKKKHSLL